MDELKIFKNEEFGEIRTVQLNNETYFVGKDIAEALGYSNPRKALSDHVEEEDKGVTKCDTLGGKQDLTVINESGLYALIFGSKLDSAKRFKCWVTSEVLPTIRKTGGYISNTDLFVNTYFDEMPEEQKNVMRGLLISIEEKQKKIKGLQAENALLTQKTLEWADRSIINALVRAYAHSIDDDYAGAWREFKKELLYRYGINLNSRKTNHLNSGGSKSKKTLDFLNDDELPQAISTAVAMCKDKNVDISEIMQKKAS